VALDTRHNLLFCFLFVPALNMNIDYKLIFSRRKKVTITVERDRSIVVRAPEGTPPDKIQAVVESKKPWLYEKLHHQQKYTQNRGKKEFVSGETVLYLGRNYRLEIEKGGEEGIRFAGKFVVTGATPARSRQRESKREDCAACQAPRP